MIWQEPGLSKKRVNATLGVARLSSVDRAKLGLAMTKRFVAKETSLLKAVRSL